MIAEDLALLRDGLTRLLRDNGFEVVAAVADGDALVHAVMLEEPEIAIVDVRLPPTFRDEGLRAALEARRRRPATWLAVAHTGTPEHESLATALLTSLRKAQSHG